MDRVESSGDKLQTLRGAHEIKRKSNKKRKARPDGGDDVCAICDDGGYITCCDGGCLRSFHLTKEHGEASKCKSLGLASEEANMIIEKENFICKNCKYKQHQCFACELLGSSDLLSGAEVFQCKDVDCGHFYHPKCVAELLFPDSKVRASLFEQRVTAGLKFLCPVHKCSACNEGENKEDVNMQFAVCRRCPTTFHRKCLPSDIPLKTENGSLQRAWDGILRDRILMYCMKHDEFVKELGIPKTKCIIFPDAKKLCVIKGPESAPKEQDILEEEELVKCPSSEPSQSPPTSANNQNHFCCSNPMDSFAPKSLFPHPYPGSCGWIDDD
uniref:Zinc finger PHD-type domain-containing protein n=1 Tax=Arundo donax TaxID=35708 RepID=A0A0A9FC37_ARUDO